MTVQKDVRRAGLRAMRAQSMVGVPEYSADPNVLSRGVTVPCRLPSIARLEHSPLRRFSAREITFGASNYRVSRPETLSSLHWEWCDVARDRVGFPRSPHFPRIVDG
jgi:hypothetical protein